MRTKLIFGILLLSVLILVCLSPGCNSMPFPTGVNGVAILEKGGGNVFPPPPITHDPFSGAIIAVQPQGGGPMVTQTADSKGGFRIEVPPGSYVLTAQAPPGQGLILAPPQQTVVVVPHQLTQIVVTFSVVSHF